MSLLSGIKFIPKNERIINPIDLEEEEINNKKRRNEKKEKKDRKDKKKHKRKYTKLSEYDDEKEEIIDMHAIAEEEEIKERLEVESKKGRMKWMDTSNNSQITASSNITNWSDHDVQNFMKKSENTMSNLLRTISQENENEEDIVYGQDNDDGGNDEHQLLQQQSQQPQDQWGVSVRDQSNNYRSNRRNINNIDNNINNERVNNSFPDSKKNTIDSSNSNNNNKLSEGLNNVSMAEILRSKLKSTKGSLISTNKSEESNEESNDKQNIIIGDIRTMYSQSSKNISGDKGLVKEDSKKGSRKGKLKDMKELDDADLKSLLANEKLGGEDMDNIFIENVLRLGDRYKGTELGGGGAFGNGDSAGVDEESDVDMKMFQRSDNYLTDKATMQRQITKAMGDKKSSEEIISRCRNCFESKSHIPSTVISSGQHSMLCLKSKSLQLSFGHCEIIPLAHTSSMLQCEEEVWIEIERYKSCLQRYFERNNRVVIFTETAMNFSKRPHSFIDVIPLVKGMEGDTKMFFKEVIYFLFLLTFYLFIYMFE
jgi:hypothetical protein